MKVLFVHHNQPDYLAESLFHGLRTLLGTNCVDVPRYDSMYAPLKERIKSKLRGNGFTLYGLLKDIPELAESRFFWRKDLDDYDLIIIGQIWLQWELFWELSSVVDSRKLVILDGHDIPAFFPYSSIGWRLRRYPWSYLTQISRFKYFKRELIGGGYSYGLDKFLPHQFHNWIPLPKNAIPISFSIPQEKISKVDIKQKKNIFNSHIVDSEITECINDIFNKEKSSSYLFYSETEYYDDLKQARFGITTKRSGWDCLRHYELAANGCVLCFRDLDLKPNTCAPHGLTSSNCIIYHSFDELKTKIASIKMNEYVNLQKMTYKWIYQNTTVYRAEYFLNICNF